MLKNKTWSGLGLFLSVFLSYHAVLAEEMPLEYPCPMDWQDTRVDLNDYCADRASLERFMNDTLLQTQKKYEQTLQNVFATPEEGYAPVMLLQTGHFHEMVQEKVTQNLQALQHCQQRQCEHIKVLCSAEDVIYLSLQTQLFQQCEAKTSELFQIATSKTKAAFLTHQWLYQNHFTKKTHEIFLHSFYTFIISPQRQSFGLFVYFLSRFTGFVLNPK